MTAILSAEAGRRPDKLRQLPDPVLRRVLAHRDRLLPALELVVPDRILDALRRDTLRVEAAAFLAYALPEREAIWWACRCVGHGLGIDAAQEQRDALAAAETWVWRPVIANQVECARAARLAGSKSAASHVSRAVCIACPSRAEAIMASRLVERAITLALADIALGDGRDDLIERFVSSALDIAQGGSGRAAFLPVVDAVDTQ